MSATTTQLLSSGEFCKQRYDTIPVKLHLLTFISIPVTQKCQILSCDTLVANERYSLQINYLLWHACWGGLCYTTEPSPSNTLLGWVTRCLILFYISFTLCCQLQINSNLAGFEVPTVVVNSPFLWDTAMCRLINNYRRYGGDYCLHLQRLCSPKHAVRVQKRVENTSIVLCREVICLSRS